MSEQPVEPPRTRKRRRRNPGTGSIYKETFTDRRGEEKARWRVQVYQTDPFTKKTIEIRRTARSRDASEPFRWFLKRSQR
ncbi:MAG: hypothetical protein WCP28_00860 [Actinomycetes bacterium]